MYYDMKNNLPNDDSYNEVQANQVNGNKNTPETLPSYPDVEDYPETLPSFPDVENYPVTLPSDQLVPNFNQPSFPGTVIGPVILPVFPGSINHAQVRFLHAAAGFGPVTITVGQKLVTNRIAYQNITSYTKINSGFRTVTIADANNPMNVIFRKSIAFVSGSLLTIAITNSANGVQLVQINDQMCTNKNQSSGCVRFANLSYGSGSFDIVLQNGETVFQDIEFTEVTPFRQARRGLYEISVFQASPGIQPRGNGNFEPLLIFPLRVSGNEMYTVYLVGSVFSSPPLESVIATNA